MNVIEEPEFDKHNKTQKGKNMPTNMTYRIKNHEGHYWDNEEFKAENKGQIFRTMKSAEEKAITLDMNGYDTEIDICVMIPLKSIKTRDDPRIQMIRNVSDKFSTDIIRCLYRMVKNVDITEYSYLLERTPLSTSVGKIVEGSSHLSYCVSNSKTGYRYLLMKSMDDVIIMKMLLEKNFTYLYDLKTGETLR